MIVLLVGCSSDDDGDGDEGPYPGVTEWRCFEGDLECWCPGLGPNDEASSSDPRVDACSYANCYVYEEFGWKCTCRPEPFEPADYWEHPKAIAACPPH